MPTTRTLAVQFGGAPERRSPNSFKVTSGQGNSGAPSRAFGELLRQHRLAAGLAQEMLAERARLSVHTISALERGTRQKPYLETIAVLADALGLSPVDRVELERAAARRLPSIATGPIIDADTVHRVPSFSGRTQELEAVSLAFGSGRDVVAITGLGGVGKSSVAREYAWHSREEYSIVWWLNAHTEDGIIEGLLRMGAHFVRSLDQLKDRRTAAQHVIRSLETDFVKPALLVFDNLEDERYLRTWEPRTGARMLVTSRNAHWSEGVTVIGVETWSREIAAEYLRRESARVDLTDTDAHAIAEALGDLPLALSHAAVSLRSMRMVTPQRYLERLGSYLERAPRDPDYPRSVFATFRAAIAKAEAQAPGAVAVLCLATCFGPDAIPDELFRQVSEPCPESLRSLVADEVRLDEALAALDRLGLMSFAQDSRTYAMHRLVRLAAQDLLGDVTAAWRACAVEFANSAFPDVEFATWPQCERVLPHARVALEALPHDADLASAASLANRCSIYLYERGEYGPAESLSTRALSIREKLLGPEHAEVARSLSSLAAACSYQGRYADAEALYARALAIHEKTLGSEHVDVGRSLVNVAIVYCRAGRYAEAEPAFVRALAILEKTLGPEHPEVSVSLTNLATLYREERRYADAERLYTRALAISQKSVGTDHPEVAPILTGLAVIYREQGQYVRAEPLYERALEIRQKTLGTDHPDVAESLHDLALHYIGRGRHEEAETLLLRALSIQEILPSNHPSLKATRDALEVVRDGQRPATSRS